MNTLEELNEKIKEIQSNRCTVEEIKQTIEKLKKIENKDNFLSTHMIPMLEDYLETRQLYEGIYEGKTTIFKHDLDLQGKYPIEGPLTIIDKKTNSKITISIEEAFKFVYLIQREISENINREYDLTHPKPYQQDENYDHNCYYEDNRKKGIPQNNDAGRQLVKAICHDNITGTAFLN